MVKLGDKKRLLTLTDGNVNGVFNDLATNPSECDHLSLEGDVIGERQLGKFLEADNQLYHLEVARDGAFVKLQKAENIPTGVVHVPDAVSEFEAVGENGHFHRKPAKGDFSLPTGKYRIHSWVVEKKDERGEAWRMSGSSFGEEADFVVAADKPVSLAIGEPVQIVLQPRQTKSEMDFSLRFQGTYHETVEIMKGATRPRAPRLTLTSLDGSYRYTNSFEFG